MAYNVPIGNWTTYVKDIIQGQETSDYIIGQNGGGDPAYGCYKNFTATYQCGNGPTKNVGITGDKVEAGGQTIKFDCSAENKICGGFVLTLGDDGNLVLTDSTKTIVWQSNTNVTGLALDEFKASNGKYGRNYLLPGEFLKIGEFMGSPSGNCYLMMVGNKTDCTQNGLQLLYNKLNCTYNSTTNEGYGNDDTANGLFSIRKTNISNLGKVNYIDEQKIVHEYPTDMTTLSQTYTFLGNYDSPGNDLSQVENTTAENCKKSCNENEQCYGALFNTETNTCYLKNANMYPNPNGTRLPSAPMEMYVRNKDVKNHFSCAKEVETGYSSDWELLPMGDKMTMDTLCNLGAVTKDEQQELLQKNNELTKSSTRMQGKLTSIQKEYNTLQNSFVTNTQTMKKNMNNYMNNNKKITTNANNFENMKGMEEFTHLNMNSQYLKYFLFSGLAIILSMATIKILRNNNA